MQGQFKDKLHFFRIPGVFEDQGHFQGLFKVCANPVNCFILRTTAVAGLGVPIFRVIMVCFILQAEEIFLWKSVPTSKKFISFKKF